jgi:hypothetical protein
MWYFLASGVLPGLTRVSEIVLDRITRRLSRGQATLAGEALRKAARHENCWEPCPNTACARWARRGCCRGGGLHAVPAVRADRVGDDLEHLFRRSWRWLGFGLATAIALAKASAQPLAAQAGGMVHLRLPRLARCSSSSSLPTRLFLLPKVTGTLDLGFVELSASTPG